MNAPILRAGALAYYNSLSGMIPCKVLSVRPNVLVATGEPAPDCDGEPSSKQMVIAVVTAAHGPWKRGDKVEGWGLRIVPRGAYRRPGLRRIHGRIGPYTVECDRSA